MAHVLVAHADPRIRNTMMTALEEVGHIVVGMSDGKLALTVLRIGVTPMVALLDEQLSPFEGLDLLGMAANDHARGPLSRHHYILMSAVPDYIDIKGRELLSRLDAVVLSQPFDLDTLVEKVDEAAEKESLMGRRHPLPFRLRENNYVPG